jgi:hypothetical protein
MNCQKIIGIQDTGKNRTRRMELFLNLEKKGKKGAIYTFIYSRSGTGENSIGELGKPQSVE